MELLLDNNQNYNVVKRNTCKEYTFKKVWNIINLDATILCGNNDWSIKLTNCY